MERLNILDGTKEMLGIPKEYSVFDQTIRMHIDSVFVTLHQLGVGPKQPFTLEDGDEKWEVFMEEKMIIRNVKSYVYLRVRLLFDPPQNAFAVTAIKEQIEQMEWRLSVQAEEEAVGQNGS